MGGSKKGKDERVAAPPSHMTVMQVTECDKGLLIFEGLLGHEKVRIMIDSGATGCFVHEALARRLKLPLKKKLSPDRVKTASGDVVQSTRWIERLAFSIGTYQDSVDVHLLDMPGQEYDLILGLPWLRQRNPSVNWKSGVLHLDARGGRHVLVPEHQPETKRLRDELFTNSMELLKFAKKSKEPVYLMTLKEIASSSPETPLDESLQSQLEKLLEEFRDVVPLDNAMNLKLPPDRGVEHTIETVPGSAPVNRHAYRLTQEELAELRRQLEDFLARGLIRPSTSPYASPVLFVKKKEGGFRMCIDYRHLNNQTVKNRYPLPRIDDLLDQLHGAKYFTKIDLASGYHQIKMKEADVRKTAFRTQLGLFEWTVLSFGLCNAPATFMRMMDDVLRPFIGKFVIVYLDDICIYSRTAEEHIGHVREVLASLREAQLVARLSKCYFGRREIEFLGHIVNGCEDEKGSVIKMDPAKIKSIVEWPEPKNSTEVLQFKGLIGFYRRFIKDFSKIAAPLSVLTGDVQFVWGERERLSFQQLKEAVTSAPVLVPPDFSKPFTVETDASKFAIGAVLSQEGRVIAFESRKLNLAECKYEVHDKELLAVYDALLKWRHYLGDSKFTLITDNWANKFIQTKPHLTPRQAKWLEVLQELNCDIVYREGAKNVVADALSRRPDYQTSAITWVSLGDDVIPSLLSAAEEDEEYKKLVELVKSGKRTDFTLEEGLLRKDDRVYVPQCPFRHKLLTEAHDAPLSGHLGRDKTYQRLQKIVYWPRMHEEVSEYCKTCEVCQAVKPSRQNKIGLLQPHDVPPRLFHTITIDFILALPMTKNGHTGILGITDSLSGLVQLIPTVTEVTAEESARLMYDHWVTQGMGIPEKIISDRDPRFISEFWRELHKLSGTKLNVSTSNHPQTDGRSEKTNSTLETIMRCYVNPFHSDWDERLPSVRFAINDAVHASTGRTPHEVVFGQSPRVPLTSWLKPSRAVPDPVVAIQEKRRAEIAEAQTAMRVAQERQAFYANQHRREVLFEVGDKVYLSNSHLRLDEVENATRKFYPKFKGPYAVLEVISPVAYRLDLPKSSKIHPVVHVSYLKEYHDGRAQFPDRPDYQPAPAPDIVDGEEHYHVERFIGHRPKDPTKLKNPAHAKFHVKWVGYPVTNNKEDFVPASQLLTDLGKANYHRLVREYLLSAPRLTLPDAWLSPKSRTT